MPKRRTCIPGWTKMRTRMYQNLRMPEFHMPAAEAPQPWQEQVMASLTDNDVTKIVAAESKRAMRCHRRIMRGF